MMFEVSKRWKRILLQVVVTIMVLPYLFPIIVMVQGSLAGEGFKNYKAVAEVPGFARFFINSAIISAGVIALVYVCAMLASYGFAKLRLFGREVYFWMLLACLTLPEVVLLAPLFTTDQKLIRGLPDELFEAVRVDGAGPVRTFRHLIVPLTRPIAAAVIIFTLIAAWNDYLMPLVFEQATNMQTITLVPQFFIGEFNDDQTKILASAVVTAIPEIVAYLGLQRLFERGLTAGAVK
jgi:multiple sugar transport system permease protein/raffinose/stachyose/melibiose transport system permease protein